MCLKDYKKWFLSVTGEHDVKVFLKKVLKKVYGLKSEEESW